MGQKNQDMALSNPPAGHDTPSGCSDMATTKSYSKYDAAGAKVRLNGGNTPIQNGRKTSGPKAYPRS